MSAAKTDDLENDPRFKFGPPPIQTAEDAEMQYLRGLINEDELRAAMAKFGQSEATRQVKPIPPDRLDTAFERKLPDDLQPTTEANVDELHDRHVKVVNAKADLREAARKEAEGDKNDAETSKREQDADWVHKLEEKHLVPALADGQTLNTPGKNAEVKSTSSSTKSE